ncbi:hypothetical protein B5M47_00145 [candidate division CPR3 bacterium 4484_211]|uniref:Fibronectin type-III domain-containing protein n=1 Tax=candidate division CPR3 bacterium 4484_211 TaxID=1968527 RepID=A0A1W9P1E6_UNCC3|nr:MAG: hypothetical protein B5M47_00145 [candidate division CPR3 bacterium 4484_211]
MVKGKGLILFNVVLASFFLSLLLAPSVFGVVPSEFVISVAPADTSLGANTSYQFSFTPTSDIPVNMAENTAGFVNVIVNYESRGEGGGEPDPTQSPDFSNATFASDDLSLVPGGGEGNETNIYTALFSNALSGGQKVSFTLGNVINPQVAGSFNVQIEVGTVELLGGEGGPMDRIDQGGKIGAFYLGNVVMGKVVDPKGNGLSMVGLELHTKDYSKSYQWGTGEDGAFSFVGVEAGDYLLEVWLSPGSGYVNPAETPAISYSGGVYDMGEIAVRLPSKVVTGKVKFGDGTVPTNVEVGANQKGGRNWLSTVMEADGTYELGLTGGEWELMLNAPWDKDTNTQLPVNWAYTNPPRIVSFADDDTEESAKVNFTVVKATARVIGQVLYPDGSPAARGGVDVRGSDGMGSGGGLNDQGVFTVNVPAGKYKLGVHLDDQSYAVPQMDPFRVGEGETKDLGTITLVKKNEHVLGRVLDKAGNGIEGIKVEAWSPGGSGWTETTSEAGGKFDLLVSPGEWEIMPRPEEGYVYMGGPPREVSLSKDQTVSGVEFKLVSATAVITGLVKDESGQVMTDLFGWAEAMEGAGDPPMPGPGTEISNGSFSLAVPAGTWTVMVHLPPGSQYSAMAGKTVVVKDNETKSVDVVVKANDARITGKIVDENGRLVKGVHVEVFGHSPTGGMKHTFVDQDTGRYVLDVVGGTSWFLGVFVDPSSGYMMRPPDDSKTVVASGKTVERNFTLLSADAAIEVTVLDPNGEPLDGVFAFADTHAGKEGEGSEDMGKGIHTGDIVDAGGKIVLQVPAGTYGVGSGAPASIGYMNPDIQRVTVAKGETKKVTLRYKASDAVIKGSVFIDGAKSSAFVWAWSDQGGHSEVMSFSGDYSLNVTKGDVWHVGADYKKEDGTFYRSPEYIVTVDSAQQTQDLALAETDFTIPPATSRSFSATNPAVITLENGAVISIPAGAIAQSGTVTVVATPTEQLAKQENARPLAFGYDLRALADGTPVNSTFNSDVTITIPYTEGMLDELGITEDQIGASYYDTTSSLWQGITSFTVDTDSNQITFTVNHFTQFALTTGGADTTPPDAPTDITAVSGSTQVELSWTNPSQADFDHVNIYRSTTEGSLGDLVKSSADSSVASYTDTGLVNGTTYYYTLRSVDERGNESTNANQVSATPEAELPVTGVSLREALGFYFQALLYFISPVFALRRKFF